MRGTLLSIGSALILVSLVTGTASAGPLECTNPQNCGVVVTANGIQVAEESFVIGTDGSVSLAAPVEYVDPSGFGAQIDSLSGNTDPEIVFGIGATNASGAAVTFAFTFSLPIGSFPEPIATFAGMTTALTASSSEATQIFPTLGGGRILDSQDIRLIPSFFTQDKGVDIGLGLSAAAGTFPTIFESATGSITSGNGPYNLMVVTVAFGLLDGPTAGGGAATLTGRVTQTPEPSAMLALGVGLVGLALARRRAHA